MKFEVLCVSSEVILLSEVGHSTDLKAELTSRKQILTAKQLKSLKSLKSQYQEVRL